MEQLWKGIQKFISIGTLHGSLYMITQILQLSRRVRDSHPHPNRDTRPNHCFVALMHLVTQYGQ